MATFHLEDQRSHAHSPSLFSIAHKGLKMITASSKPARGFLVLFVILLIYYFQPFTASLQAGNSRTPTASRSWSSWGSKNSGAPKAPTDIKDAIFAGEGGPRVRQATMIYDTDKFNAVYERSVDSHIKHGKQWDVPTHVLRHDVVDAGFFNKPAFLLGLVIEEMAKPYGQRADWIV